MASKVKRKRYYRQGSTMSVEEDSTHEFKGHRNLTYSEIPNWANGSNGERASRQQISKALNAFLNTGKGGTVYMGVPDCGTVKGLTLTLYQKDHILGSLQDAFSRYAPAVPAHMYKVRFITVVPPSLSDEEAQEYVTNAEGLYNDTSQRKHPHTYRMAHFCWCDKEAVARINVGVLPSEYVIEITIRPWDATNPKNTNGFGTFINIHPIYEDEDGNAYIRLQASVVKYSMNEIAELTRLQVREACEEKIKRLKEQIEACRISATS